MVIGHYVLVKEKGGEEEEENANINLNKGATACLLCDSSPVTYAVHTQKPPPHRTHPLLLRNLHIKVIIP